jgi:crotonobetainyl-CoA:carnitine CoA-transferase CaiB-like acyl-CoA transferase
MSALDGMRVLELGQVMAAPYCGMLLADMGADVIKIEKPNGGDDSRRMGPPFVAGESAAFLALNRNKRSVVIDLKTEGGKNLVREMAMQADVLIENFRTGTMDKLGLGYEALHQAVPTLIYCSISGFGATGPYRERGGFDLVAQGMSGLMSITGEPDGAPVKVGVPIADLNAGLLAAYAVLAAYIHRLRTGVGQHIDTSLFEAGIATTFWETASFFASGQIPKPLGSAHRLSAPYQAFRTADGYVTVGAANQSNWEKFCTAIERPDLLTDLRFISNAERMTHLQELQACLAPVLASCPSHEWLARFEKAGLPSGPIYDIAQVYDDPQARAREMIVELPHPAAGATMNIGIPIKLSETPGKLRRSAPLLGEHTAQVLKEFGFSEETLEFHAAQI